MTSGLSASAILWIWECGRDRHPVDRALLILAAAHPELPAGALSRLSIGERDARLIDLRIATLGTRLDGTADCPQCGAPLEFSIDAGELRTAGREAERNEPIEIEEAGTRLQLRRPDSRDLARIALLPAGADAAQALLQSCILATGGDDTVDVDALSPEMRSRISEIIAERDPQADISFDLRCAACGQSSPLVFDIASFFWTEIAGLAQRLLREVDALARAYGWREADILALSPARRRLYLEMVT